MWRWIAKHSHMIFDWLLIHYFVLIKPGWQSGWNSVASIKEWDTVTSALLYWGCAWWGCWGRWWMVIDAFSSGTICIATDTGYPYQHSLNRMPDNWRCWYRDIHWKWKHANLRQDMVGIGAWDVFLLHQYSWWHYNIHWWNGVLPLIKQREHFNLPGAWSLIASTG